VFGLVLQISFSLRRTVKRISFPGF